MFVIFIGNFKGGVGKIMFVFVFVDQFVVSGVNVVVIDVDFNVIIVKWVVK